MFNQRFKKKSKITPGLLIMLGIVFMSMVVIINNSLVLQKIENDVKNYKEYKQVKNRV